MTILAWSDDRVELLKKLWEAGLSASQIACELGAVTRNAVIGKVHRLGLTGHAKSPSFARPRQRKERPAQHRMYLSRSEPRIKAERAESPEADADPGATAYNNSVPMSQRLSLMQLDEATCHWPIGNPESAEFFFCGGKSLSSLPYCVYHSRIAYQPHGTRKPPNLPPITFRQPVR